MPRRGHARCTCLAQQGPHAADIGDVRITVSSSDHADKDRGFGRHGLHVYLFVRKADHRARILCETPERSGSCWYSCMPFNRIQLRRSRSMITLYSRLSGTNTFTPWTTLPFSSMESSFTLDLITLKHANDAQDWSCSIIHVLRYALTIPTRQSSRLQTTN